jgi:type IV pilus assembly protein PilA
MKAAINNLRLKRKDEGFTLVELLVVVVIIGVLVAIAIPMYGSYRKGAANKSAQSDVRGAITAVEQFYTENGNKYPADKPAGTAGLAVVFPGITGTPQTATVSPNNVLGFDANNDPTGGDWYAICAKNSDGGVYYVYNSSNGQSVHKTTAANVTSVATCLSSETYTP